MTHFTPSERCFNHSHSDGKHKVGCLPLTAIIIIIKHRLDTTHWLCPPSTPHSNTDCHSHSLLQTPLPLHHQFLLSVTTSPVPLWITVSGIINITIIIIITIIFILLFLFISVYWQKLIVCWHTVWRCCLNKNQNNSRCEYGLCCRRSREDSYHQFSYRSITKIAYYLVSSPTSSWKIKLILQSLAVV